MFLFTSPEGDIGTGTLKRIQSEFSELLGEQASVEEYAEWIKELIDKLVVKVCQLKRLISFNFFGQQI